MRSAPARPDAGFTLVELLVTVIVSALVAVSTYTFFAGQQLIYDQQTKVLNVQQNLWAAMEVISRHVRAAGTGMLGCVAPADPAPVGVTVPLTGLRVNNPNPTPITGVTRIPPLWIQSGAAAASDSITVAYGENTFGSWTDATLTAAVLANQPTTAFTVRAGQTSMFRLGEFGLLFDGERTPTTNALGDHTCMLFQVSGFNVGANQILHTNSITYPWNAAAAVAGLDPWQLNPPGTPASALVGAGLRHFGQLRWVQFAINAAANPPTLTMNRLEGTAGPQVLADGVENLQVAYACDSQPVGVPDGVLSEGAAGNAAARNADEWILNQGGDATPAACNMPSAVRITIGARSNSVDETLLTALGNQRPAAEDRAAGAVDRFRHRSLTTTIYLRNQTP